MSLAVKLRMAAGSSTAVDILYVDDVFSAWTYTGNGSTQTITNGTDLAGKGGLVWIKDRTAAYEHVLYDTSNGVNNPLNSNNTSAISAGYGGLTSFLSTGFSLNGWSRVNTFSNNYISWTFCKAPKFFDVVTYTGNGASRAIAHSLGIAPGMVIVKATSQVAAWRVWHRSPNQSVTYSAVLNSTAAYADQGHNLWGESGNADMNATSFSIGSSSEVNASGQTYVAYLFAHDTSADGIIQCGVVTSAYEAVTLGWEPQYILVKRIDTTGSWRILDTARGLDSGSSNQGYLLAESSAAEAVANLWNINATGFKNTGNSGSLIYLAIRRPNKPPTVGTQVYNAIARTGTGVAATVTGVGFAPDLVALHSRSGTTGGRWEDRLRGATQELVAETTAAEAAVAQSVISFGMDGISLGTDGDWNTNAATYINHFFKRAPGVFDIVCYTGTGVAHTEAHSLTSAPELWLVKGRSGATQWVWGSSLLANTEKIVMPSPAGKVTDATAWNSTYPTSSVISLGTAAAVNTSSATYAAYLWATKAGISKVFGYTGDGAAGKVINCGFTTGARFVMIVRTDTSGSVFIWDTVRGIVSGNDPHLCLDTTAAEVTTDDSIDPNVVGFYINQVAATNINVNGAVYIGLAYA